MAPAFQRPRKGLHLLAALWLAAAGSAEAQVPAPLPKPDIRLTAAGEVSSSARLPDGSLVLVGTFTAIDGVPRDGLARLRPDGALDEQWYPRVRWTHLPATAAQRRVYALPDGSVLLHSDADTIDGQPYMSCGAKFAPGPTSVVTATWHQNAGCPWTIAFDDQGWFYVRGMGMIRRGHVDTGVLDTAWYAFGDPYGEMIYDGNGGLIVNSSNGLVRVLTATGAVDASWQAPATVSGDAVVDFSIDPAGDALYVAYWFGPLRKLSLSDGHNIAGWTPGGWLGDPRTIQADADGHLYVGGKGKLMKLSGTTGALLQEWQASGIHDGVVDLVFDGGRLLVGGSFGRLGQTRAMGLAVLPAAATEPVALASAQTRGYADYLALQHDGSLIVAGSFDRADAAERRYLLRLLPDGSLDPAWVPQPDGPVRSIAVDSHDDVYVAGDFDSVDGQARYGVAKLDGAGGHVANWNPDLDPPIASVAVDAADRVYVVPFYTQSNSAYRILPDGSGADPAWTIGGQDNYGRSIHVFGDHAYVRTRDVSSGEHVRRIALATASVDPDWSLSLQANTVRSAAPSMLQLADGDLLIVLSDQVNGVARKGIARVSATTPPLVRDWDPQPNGLVYDVASGADGRLFVVGGFTAIGAKPRNGIAEISPGNAAAVDSWIAPHGGAHIVLAPDRLFLGTSAARSGPTAYPLNIGDTIFATRFD